MLQHMDKLSSGLPFHLTDFHTLLRPSIWHPVQSMKEWRYLFSFLFNPPEEVVAELNLVIVAGYHHYGLATCKQLPV